jgi:hypothetical protein
MYNAGLIHILIACSASIHFDIYQPRNPKARGDSRCVEDHGMFYEKFVCTDVA